MIGYTSSHAVNLSLLPHPTAPLNQVQKLAKGLILALGAPFVHLTKQKYGLPLHLAQLLPAYLRLGGQMPPFTALLGTAQDGAPLLVRLPSPIVGHILIAGMPGSGKTTLTQTIILSLALLHRRSQLMFVIIDPMQRALGHLGQLPHLLWPVIGNASDAVDALDELVQLIEARQLTQTHAPRIVVIVDEIDPLLQLAGSRAPQALARLTQRGRGAGIHIIVCAQKPSLLSWATLTQASFPVRLVGQMANSKEAYAATNLESSGAEKLGGCGDFIGIAQGTLWHFQSAFATPAEGNQLVEQLNNGLRSWDIVPYQ